VSGVARRLREHALATTPGQLIGSEDQLVAAYGVSRPTLRHAAALVNKEQLLRVRRGVGGGYFARRPEVGGVAHAAAIYLQTQQATLQEIIRAIEPLKAEMGMLAAKNRDVGILNIWRDFKNRDSELAKSGGYRDFLKAEREFGQIIGSACQNRVLDLFVATLYEFCGYLGPSEDVFRDHPERVRDYWTRRELLVRAIIEGDGELASFTARRCARMVTTWVVEDMGGASKPAVPDRLLE